MRDRLGSPDLVGLGIAPGPLGERVVDHLVHEPRVGALVRPDRDPRGHDRRFRRPGELHADDPRRPRRLVAARDEELTRTGVRVRLRLADTGLAEGPGARFDPREERGPDASPSVRGAHVGLGAAPVELGPRRQVPALEHQERVEIGFEPVAFEADGDVVSVDLHDTVVLELARRDQLVDGFRVRHVRRPGAETLGKPHVHGDLQPGQRSPPTGPARVSMVSRPSRTSSNVSHRWNGTPSSSQIATSASFAKTMSEYSAP